MSLASIIRALVPKQYRPIGYLTALAQAKTGQSVASGPFVGMKYVNDSHGSAYIPKLLGLYELELRDCIRQIVALQPDVIVDCGAAEGYYAVGLAMRCPGAAVVAFELEDGAREGLRAMARLNGVEDRVDIRGRCDASHLQRCLAEGATPVVVCDVEGGEDEILDPGRAPALARASILVELHDFLVPGLRDRLSQRFSPSHDITSILQEPRLVRDFPWRTPFTTLLPQRYREWAVSEWRPVPMEWFWMTPKRDHL